MQKMEEVNENMGEEQRILVQKSGYGSIKKPLLTRRKERLQQILKTKDMGKIIACRSFLQR